MTGAVTGAMTGHEPPGTVRNGSGPGGARANDGGCCQSNGLAKTVSNVPVSEAYSCTMTKISDQS